MSRPVFGNPKSSVFHYYLTSITPSKTTSLSLSQKPDLKLHLPRASSTAPGRHRRHFLYVSLTPSSSDLGSSHRLGSCVILPCSTSHSAGTRRCSHRLLLAFTPIYTFSLSYAAR
ncbi:hypothetical protein RND81_13G094000 [Saponaria officinalis]|uniref:Uncharacterized protein n=1 Tax=Saponaria officinalis TaxID=3572 RepID=A0AAW1H5C3_SAPOF